MDNIIHALQNNYPLYVIMYLISISSLVIALYITWKEKHLYKKRGTRTETAVLVLDSIGKETKESVIQYIQNSEELKKDILAKSFCNVRQYAFFDKGYEIEVNKDNRIIVITEDIGALSYNSAKRIIHKISELLYWNNIKTIHVFATDPSSSPFFFFPELRKKFIIDLYQFDRICHEYRFIGKIDSDRKLLVNSHPKDDYQNKCLLSISYSNATALSPDGKYMIIGFADGSLHIWDIVLQKQMYVLESHTGYITSVTCSPDAKLVLTTSLDKTACIWDIHSGFLLHTLVGHKDGVTSAHFSPDGKTIVTTSIDRTVRLWNVASGMLEHTYENNKVSFSSALFTPEGKSIITSSDDGKSYEWSVKDGTLIRIFS